MNSPVAPQSTRAVTDLFSAVSVVSISTFKLSEEGLFSVTAMTNFAGNDLSRLGRRRVGGGVGGGVGVGYRGDSGFSTSGVSVSESVAFSIESTLKRLLVHNKGVLFTHCVG